MTGARALSLTAKGRTQFARLDERAQKAVIALLDAHGEKQQQDIVAHMQNLLELLGPPQQPARSVTLLRPPRAGDLGWVIHRQAILYAQEYG